MVKRGPRKDDAGDKRKGPSKPTTGGGGNWGRSEAGSPSRYATDGGSKGPRANYATDGGSKPPRANTYRREGAVGGWNKPYNKPSDDTRRPSEGRRPSEDFRRPTPVAVPSESPARARGPVPVPARKLKEGIRAANRALAELMEEFGSGVDGDYDISQLEATVSFDATGTFLGFGEGGNASLKITLTPLDAESVFERDDVALASGSVSDLDELEATGNEDVDLDDDDDDIEDDADAEEE